jgi:hypothetical protein
MSSSRTSCADVPHFDRIHYFYGQMLGVREFAGEQAYFREKLKLHNRCLHGYGAVCGLAVTPVGVEPPCGPPVDCGDGRDPAGGAKPEVPGPLPAAAAAAAAAGAMPAERPAPLAEPAVAKQPALQPGLRPSVVVHCGLAIDCEGNELIVRAPITIDLVASLGRADRAKLEGLGPEAKRAGVSFYVSLCYCEQPLEPVRPMVPDACGSTAGCEFGRYRDSVSLHVTLEPPVEDERCEPCCCGECCEPCLLLARVDQVMPGAPVEADDVHNEVRRMLGPYTPTTITGISWRHGATYSKEDERALIGFDDPKAGLVIEFSREVHAETLQDGVIDLWLISGGGGGHDSISAIDGEFVDLPPSGFVKRVTYRQRTEADDEPHDYGDRILITVRSPFILDKCCQPLAGAHTGRLPILKGFERFDKDLAEQAAAADVKPAEADVALRRPCAHPRDRFGPWTTDPRGGPVNFESWFWIEEKRRSPK